MDKYDNTNRIATWENEKGDNQKRPDFTGHFYDATGKKHAVSLWLKESSSGQRMITGQVLEWKERSVDKPEPAKPVANDTPFEDEIPF